MENKSEHYFKISKQAGISYFFNFIIIAFQPLLIALLTRVLSIKEFGVYSLLFTTISLLAVFFRFGTAEYIKAKIPGLKEESRVRIIITILLSSLVFLIIGAIILYFVRKPIINFLKIDTYAWLWTLSIPLIVFIALYEIIDSYLQSIKKVFIKSFLSFFVKCFWVVLLFILFFVAGDFSLGHVFIAWLLGIIFSFSLTIFFIRHEIFYFLKHSLKLDFNRLISSLKFSLPLVFVISFTWIVEVSDRYIINYFLGKSEVGIYSLAYGLVTVIISIPIIFQNVIQPYFAEKWNLKRNSSLFFNIMLKYSLIMVFPAIVGMFVLRNEIISLISGPKYLVAAPLILVLLPYPLFAVLTSIFDKIMFLRDMIKHMVIIYFMAAIINISLNLFFIPLMGTVAAAYSTVVSFFFVLVVMFCFRPRKIRVQPNYLKTLRILAASILMGVIIAPINPVQYWYKIIIIVLGVMIYGLFLFMFGVFNKEEKGLMLYIYNKFKSIFS